MARSKAEEPKPKTRVAMLALRGGKAIVGKCNTTTTDRRFGHVTPYILLLAP